MCGTKYKKKKNIARTAGENKEEVNFTLLIIEQLDERSAVVAAGPGNNWRYGPPKASAISSLIIERIQYIKAPLRSELEAVMGMTADVAYRKTCFSLSLPSCCLRVSCKMVTTLNGALSLALTPPISMQITTARRYLPNGASSATKWWWWWYIESNRSDCLFPFA